MIVVSLLDDEQTSDICTRRRINFRQWSCNTTVSRIRGRYGYVVVLVLPTVVVVFVGSPTVSAAAAG
jgi:hypothetical protein